MVKTRSRDQGKFLVRLPDDMLQTIRRRAAEADRTMTDEVIARLGWSIEEEKRSPEGKVSFQEYASRSALAQMEVEIRGLERELSELKAKIVSTKSKFAATRLLKL